MDKRKFCSEHVRVQRASGLSQARYCVEQGLNASSFGYWSSRLSKEQAVPGSDGRFSPVKAGAPLEVAIGKVVIRLPPGSDMRRGFDVLAQMVESHFGKSVRAEGVYVFFSRTRDRAKLDSPHITG